MYWVIFSGDHSIIIKEGFFLFKASEIFLTGMLLKLSLLVHTLFGISYAEMGNLNILSPSVHFYLYNE